MSLFRFIPVTPHPVLSPFIDKMHVFESNGLLPDFDRILIVPNSNLKLTYTYCNGIIAQIAGKSFLQNESKISLTGLIDTPVYLDSKENTQTGTIIIEFNPLGAYRFFQLSYIEVQNQIVELEDFLGNKVNELKTLLLDSNTLNEKLQVLQLFLLGQLNAREADPIYDYCINRISSSKGLTTIAQLEKETGYSSRWLNKKFIEHLGTGPKNLCEIVRFKQFYQAYSTCQNLEELKAHIYQYYYDQSHFLRSFKRFTGTTPSDLRNSQNELAHKHYTT